MPTIYEKCDEDAPHTRVIRAMMAKYHEDLKKAGVTIECLLASNEDGNAVKLHGWPCYATIKVMSYKDRVAGSADARMVIDLDKWADLHENERNALVDHELQHLELVLDKFNHVKTDDIGRPKLRLRPHDYELSGFNSVVRRHEDASIEVRNFIGFATSEDGQMVMDFAKVG
jgi:hypothetical protein